MNHNNNRHRFFSSTLRVEIVDVTPALARSIMKGNWGNRRVRQQHVASLKASFLRGEYRMTHQGIAIGRDGRVIDGQHRLTAISEMPEDFVFKMMVTYGLEDDAYTAVDIGAKRSAADALQATDVRLVEEANFVANTILNSTTKASPAMLLPIMEALAPVHDSLMQACPSNKRLRSSTPVRMAAIVAILEGNDPSFVLGQYRALVLLDGEVLTPATNALLKRMDSGSLSASKKNDLFAASLVAFDESCVGYSRVVVKVPQALQRVRDLFGHLVQRPALPTYRQEPKKEAASAAASSDLPQEYFTLPKRCPAVPAAS